MQVLLFITATGKYIEFLDELITSSEKYFLPGYEKHYLVFTDSKLQPQKNITSVKTPHREWPYSTLLRCSDYSNFIKNNPEFISAYTFCFAIDADAYFALEINEEILANSVAVQHCAFVNQKGTFEENVLSKCHVPLNQQKTYFGGGFYGGNIYHFSRINRSMNELLQLDQENGIMPLWHDESALNKYFSEYPPEKILSPEYHYPLLGPGNGLNPYIESIWEEQAQFIQSKWGLKLPLSPKIALIDKYQGKSNGAEIWREKIK